MLKKYQISNIELTSIFNILHGDISLNPVQTCIDTVYLASYNLQFDKTLLETFAVIPDKNKEDKKHYWEIIQDEIHLHQNEIDDLILKNKKVINDFINDIQNECEEKEILFNEKLILSFWKNLAGGPYGGGKSFVKNVIKNICSYTTESSYKSNVFLDPLKATPLIFDKGAMSYICARPSAGKTTALINIMLDGLHQGKKVAFFTAEETIEQLCVKSIKNEFYSLCNNPEYQSLLMNGKIDSNSQVYFKKRIKYLFSMTEEERKELINRVKGICKDQELIDYMILKAVEYINEKAESEEVQFISVSLLNGFEGLLKEVSLLEPGTIVLFDYIQKLPIPQSAINYSMAYSQIKNIVNELSSTVRDNGLIGIAGAQMGRETDKGKSDQLLSMSYIRECGDIENDATLCIGIGKNKETNQRFYNVMKSRNNEYNETKLVLLQDDYAFSYARPRGILQKNGMFELEFYSSSPTQLNNKKILGFDE